MSAFISLTGRFVVGVCNYLFVSSGSVHIQECISKVFWSETKHSLLMLVSDYYIDFQLFDHSAVEACKALGPALIHTQKQSCCH